MAEARDKARTTTFQVFLAPPSDDPLGTWLGRLAKVYGLDVHGSFLLSRRAAIEMGFAAVLLTVIFLFDLGAWYLLFNSIFHSTKDLLDLSWSSPFALLAGLLIASAVVIYERGFISADTSGNWLRIVGAFLLRTFIIIVTALITAQPVELLVFRGPIQRRLHEEGTRAELVARRREILERQETARVAAELKANVDEAVENTPEGTEATVAKNAEIEARSQQAAVERRLSAANSEVARLTNAMTRHDAAVADAEKRMASADGQVRMLRSQMDNESDEADRQELQRKLSAQEVAYQTAVGDKRRAEEAKADAEARRAEQQSLVDSLPIELEIRRSGVEIAAAARRTADENRTERRRELEQEHAATIQTKEEEIAELRQYIDKVRKEGLGDEPVVWIVKPGQPPKYEYPPPRRDFFDQLRVLQDLRAASAAKWPITDEKLKGELCTDFGLDCYPDKHSRLLTEGKLYDRAYWVTLGIAFVIPLLVLAVKLLMPRELSAYYSTQYQAINGNPEALLLTRARDEIRARRRARRRAFWQGLYRLFGRRRAALGMAVAEE